MLGQRRLRCRQALADSASTLGEAGDRRGEHPADDSIAGHVGFLLPLPFLGERAARVAIVALTAYALLPILRNTYAGIQGIDRR